MYTFFEKSHLKKCGADVLDCLGVSEFLYDAKTDISEYFTDDIGILLIKSVIPVFSAYSSREIFPSLFLLILLVICYGYFCALF